MSGANIFLLYQSADGKNVTLSPRLGKGYVEPEYESGQGAQLSLLAGSGVSNGVMTANVKCTGCASWSGGSMDFKSSSASWVWAVKEGTPIKSDDLNQGIQKHTKSSAFTWDFSNAKGGSAANPFVAAAASPASSMSSGTSGSTRTSGNAMSSTMMSGTMTTGSSGSMTTAGGASASQSSSSGYTTTTTMGSGATTQGPIPPAIIIAHAVLATLAIAFLLPLGGILIRVANFPGLVWVHATIQYVALAMFIAAFGLGAYYANRYDLWTEHHPILGTIVFVLMLCQPALGLLHHRGFKKIQSRNAFSWAHVGIGRFIILLGIINGGFGLVLAEAAQSERIGYGVAAGFMGLMYLAAIVYGERKRGKKAALGSRTSSNDHEAKAGHSNASRVE